MNAKLQATPDNILDKNFAPENLHPADIEQIIVAGFEEFQEIPKGTRIKSLYRAAYNQLVDLLTEKRGFRQFNYL